MDIADFSFQLRALLGQATLSKPEVHSLNIGDIILLDQKTSEPITLIVGEKQHLKATLGLEGAHKAVKIGDAHE